MLAHRASTPHAEPRPQNSCGKRFEISADPKQVKARGGKGQQIIKRAQLIVVPTPVKVQPLANAEGGQGVN